MLDALLLVSIVALPFLLELALVGLRDSILLPAPDEYLATACLVLAAAALAALLLRRNDLARRAALGLFLTTTLVAAGQVIVHFGLTWKPLGLALIAGPAAGACAAAAALRLFQAVLFRRLAALVAIGLAAAPCLLHLPGRASNAPRPARPDVLLIVLDTARADHLSAYGYGRATTPAIDRLSERARLYTRAWSPAPWTPPAHASLLTGLLPAQHGCDGAPFSVAAPTLAEALGSAGYRTFAAVNNPQLSPAQGWSRGFDEYRAAWDRPLSAVSTVFWELRRRQSESKWRGDTARTLAWTRRWWAAHAGRPRFVLLNLLDPHAPYGDRDPDVFFDERTSAAPDLSFYSEDYDAGLLRAGGAALERVVARYDADLLHIDQELGRFFDWLEQRGELDGALVVLTADHGERLGERGLLGHQLGLDEALLRVPLVLRYPPALAPGRVDRPVQTHGVFATVLGFAGVSAPEPLPRALALDSQESPVVVAQMRHQGWYLRLVAERNPEFDPAPFSGDWASACDGEFKLVRSSAGPARLFRLPDDPAETRDVSSAHPETLARLAAALDALPPFALPLPPVETSDEADALLRELGYVGGRRERAEDR
ncbi:MAG: sulfatase [Planctomycetes bacterium]|nr:sulfatase [Planctomycetota bacterium]